MLIKSIIPPKGQIHQQKKLPRRIKEKIVINEGQKR
jgi:hypothetical protein